MGKRGIRGKWKKEEEKGKREEEQKNKQAAEKWKINRSWESEWPSHHASQPGLKRLLSWWRGQGPLSGPSCLPQRPRREGALSLPAKSSVPWQPGLDTC